MKEEWGSFDTSRSFFVIFVVKMRTKALNNEKDNSVSSMPYCKC